MFHRNGISAVLFVDLIEECLKDTLRDRPDLPL
jgi:hypothetical protein